MIISSQDISMSAKSSRSITASCSRDISSTFLANTGENAEKISFYSMLQGLNGSSADACQDLTYDSDGKYISIWDQQADSGSNALDQLEAATSTGSVGNTNSNSSSFRKIQAQTLEYLLYILLYKRFGMSQEEVQKILGDTNLYSETQIGGGLTGWTVNREVTTISYSDEESYEFSTTGKVVTADGREIEFGITAGMSRSFYQEISSQETYMCPEYVDPLVINLDQANVDVSDQTFYFDLDADGVEDEIHQLGAGSGFLALDKNGNGTIDDGSELFGTKSGDGFTDLSDYDLDGNGWIDEADPIFDQLRIWTMDQEGNSQCYKLSEKDVGAICLQNITTNYHINDESNDAEAAIRSTGFFLYESGGAGTIQHVDMAM